MHSVGLSGPTIAPVRKKIEPGKENETLSRAHSPARATPVTIPRGEFMNDTGIPLPANTRDLCDRSMHYKKSLYAQLA
jgi:hypothetical protein